MVAGFKVTSFKYYFREKAVQLLSVLLFLLAEDHIMQHLSVTLRTLHQTCANHKRAVVRNLYHIHRAVQGVHQPRSVSEADLVCTEEVTLPLQAPGSCF